MAPHQYARSAFAALATLLVCSGCSLSNPSGEPSRNPAGVPVSSPSRSALASSGPSSSASPPALTSPAAVPSSGGTPAGSLTPGQRSSTTTLTLTFSGWNPSSSSVEVSGFVPVIEVDGTCTLALTKSGVTVTTSSAASPDAGSTSCGWLAAPGSQMSSGSWTAVLSYKSAANSARSAAVAIEVP